MISCAFTRGLVPDSRRHSALLHRSNGAGFRVLGSILAVLMAMAATAVRASDDDLPLNAKLLVAARNADGPAIARALQQGAAVNSRNRLGESALIIVLKKDRVDLARVLLDAGADVNQAAINGVTPLMTAAYGGHTEIARTLVAKGADIAVVDRLKKNAIIYAAGEGRSDIVKLLLDKGVDPNAAYANDLTALMWAAGYGRTETVKMLLAAGAKTSLKDNRGKTAADIARDAKYDETAQLLAQIAERP